MSALHYGFQIPNHDEVYSRMNLISTVPLKVDQEEEQKNTESVLDEVMKSTQKILSKHTRNIDCWLSSHDKGKSKLRQEVLLPFDRGPPIEYTDHFFISSSPAIEKPQLADQNDEKTIETKENENQKISDQKNSEENSKKEETDDTENSNESEVSEEESEYQSEQEQVQEEAKVTKKSKELTKKTDFDMDEFDAPKRFKPLIKTRHLSPEPCTYEPNFEAILPTINVPQLPPKESKDSVETPKEIELSSPAEVLNMYNTNLRNFDTKNVHIQKFESLNVRYPNEDKDTYDYISKPSAAQESAKLATQTSSVSSTSESSSENNFTSTKLNSKKNSIKSKTRSFKNSSLIEIEKDEKRTLRPTSTLASKVPRDEIFRNNSPSKFLSPGEYNLPQPKPPNVLDMSCLHDRDCLPVKKGSTRIYPHAVEQLDNIMPKKPFHKFSSDTSRETAVRKNRRVEMLDKFKREKNDLINSICMKSASMSAKISAKSSASNLGEEKKSARKKVSIGDFGDENVVEHIRRRQKAAAKKRSPFDIQSPRPSSIFGEKDLSNEPEQFYPCNPIESFKKMKPDVKFVTILRKTKPLSDEQFWKSTWYGT